MKTHANICKTVLAAIVAATLFYTAPRVAAQAPQSLSQLTKLSARETVNLADVELIRLPCYSPPVQNCDDCQTRWGATIVLKSGTSFEYSGEAEKELMKLVGTTNVVACPTR